MQHPLPRKGNSPDRMLVRHSGEGGHAQLGDGGARIENELLWKSRYSLLREFIDYMTPLYQVLKGTDEAPQTKQHYLAVPTDESLEASGLMTAGGRVSHASVRAHIISRSRVDGVVTTMLGARIELQLRDQESAPTSTRSSIIGGRPSASAPDTSPPGSATRRNGANHSPPASAQPSGGAAHLSSPSVDLFAGFGSISVTHASGERCNAEVLGLERLRSGSGGGGCLVILFISAPLLPHRDDALQARRAHGSVTLVPLGGGVQAPLPAAAQRRSVPPNGDWSAECGHASMVAASKPSWQKQPCFASTFPPSGDADSFRTILEGIAAEKAPGMVHRCNTAMTHIDAELAIFCSSYVCVAGFEEYIVARVNQITEGGIEKFQDGDDGAACEGEMWDDDQTEEIVVGFHTIVTAGVSELLVKHWELVNEVEDIAFHHACVSLRRKLSISDFTVGLEPSDGAWELCNFEAAIEQLEQLDTQSGLSVFSYMRLMENVITLVVEAAAAAIEDVTADVCIPLVVYIIVSAAPRRLPTLLKYLMDFMIPILEMSSLGYSYTTFEAASAQVMEEYISRVQNKV